MSGKASEKLIEPDIDDVLAFCRPGPVERVFLEDVARRGHGRFLAMRAEDEPRLQAICHLGTNVVPSGRGLRGVRRRRVEGGRAHADRRGACRDRVCSPIARRKLPRPRDDRPGQPVYAISTPPEPGATGLRAARVDDLDLLVPACAASHLEELGVDPLRRDPEGFRWRTRTQIEEGRSWLWEVDGVIRFKAEASAWTPSAVQLQQVWVDPSARRQGFATCAMRDLDPAPARTDAGGDPVRAQEQPPRHPAVRGARDAARAELPQHPAVKTLILARHGEAGSNAAATVSGIPPGEGLTAEGRLQAAPAGRGARARRGRPRCGDRVAAQPGDARHSHSPGATCPHIVVPLLNEIRFGAFDGGPLAAYRRWAWSEEPDVRPPGDGESRAEVAARVADATRSPARPRRGRDPRRQPRASGPLCAGRGGRAAFRPPASSMSTMRRSTDLESDAVARAAETFAPLVGRAHLPRLRVTGSLHPRSSLQ